MSVPQEFLDIFADLPEEERLPAAFDAILECIKQGRVVAIPDGDDVVYRHPSHCTPDELESRLTVAEVERGHAWYKRGNMRENN